MKIHGVAVPGAFFSRCLSKKPSLSTLGITSFALTGAYLYVDSVYGYQSVYKWTHRFELRHLKKQENLEELTDKEARKILSKELESSVFPLHLLDKYKGKSPDSQEEFEKLITNTQEYLSQEEKKPPFYSLKSFAYVLYIPFVLSLWELWEEPPIFFKLWNLEFRQKLTGFLKMPFTTPLTLHTSKRVLRFLLSLSHRYGMIDKNKTPFKSLFKTWERLLHYPLQSLSEKDKKSVIELVEVLLITLVVYYFHLREQQPYVKGSLQLASVDKRCFSLPHYKEALPRFSLKNKELLVDFCMGSERVTFLSADDASSKDWELQSLGNKAVCATLKNFELMGKAQRAMGMKNVPNLFYFDPSPFNQLPGDSEDKKASRLRAHRTSLLYLEKKMRKAEAYEHIPLLVMDGKKLMGFLESNADEALSLYRDFFSRIQKIPALKIAIKNPPLENCKYIHALLPDSPMLHLDTSPAHLLCQSFKKPPFLFCSSNLGEDSSEKLQHLNTFCKYHVAYLTQVGKRMANVHEEVQKEFLNLINNYQNKLVEKIQKLKAKQPELYEKYQKLKKVSQGIEDLKQEGKKLSVSLVGCIEGRDIQSKKLVVDLLEESTFAKISSRQCLLYGQLLPLLKEKQELLREEIIQTLEKNNSEGKKLDFFSYLVEANEEKKRVLN